MSFTSSLYCCFPIACCSFYLIYPFLLFLVSILTHPFFPLFLALTLFFPPLFLLSVFSSQLLCLFHLFLFYVFFPSFTRPTLSLSLLFLFLWFFLPFPLSFPNTPSSPFHSSILPISLTFPHYFVFDLALLFFPLFFPLIHVFSTSFLFLYQLFSFSFLSISGSSSIYFFVLHFFHSSS